MHDDYFSEHYEWDADGKPRRKKRVARDREQIHFPVTVMDHAAYGFHSTFADGTPDFTSPHRKGFRFADSDDSARCAADAAYEQMRTRLSDAWRNKDQQHDDGTGERVPPRLSSLDELHAQAEQAWHDRNERMKNAWRQR